MPDELLIVVSLIAFLSAMGLIVTERKDWRP